MPNDGIVTLARMLVMLAMAPSPWLRMVVDQDIDAAVALQCMGRQRLDLLAAAHVGCHDFALDVVYGEQLIRQLL